MKENFKKWWLIFRTTGRNFLNDKPFVYSSSIACFAIFSLPAILFMLGKYLIGFYLSRSNFIHSYGAAGSLVALYTDNEAMGPALCTLLPDQEEKLI